ncbi:hypothetical protein CcaverHIS631_0604080 [Cutaneotrichosporon cavernicola]|nr:hypothetical protein CcaverHIS631_0604080 [Cutaneotrichosporon cavernicola]
MRPPMRPTLLFLALLAAVVAEPTGWNLACNPSLSVCSRCTITWTGASAVVSAKVVDAAGSGSSCSVSKTGDSCTWDVGMAPGSVASVVLTLNGTDYSHTLDPPSSQPASKGPTTPKPDPAETTANADKPTKQVKTTTKVSTAPPTELTTTDEQGRTTTIVLPGAVITTITTVDDEPTKGLSTGTVAAIASVSSIAGLALIIGGWYACRKSRRRNEEMELEDSILFGPPRHGSAVNDPFLSPLSNATPYDAQEVLGPVAGQRTSGYGGPGIASTFPARYTDPYSEPSSPTMRPSSRTSAPNSPVMMPRNRSAASLDRLSRPSSLVLVSEPTVSAKPAPRYANDDVAEFVTTGTPVTMRSLVPGRRRQSAGIPDRPRSWVDTDDRRVSMTHEQMVTAVARQRDSRGSRDLDATQPLLQR